MPETAQLPQWKSHKTVDAAKIEEIRDGGELVLEGGHVVTPGPAWMNKHHPDVGWYFVRYADGYESASPAQAFEEGYSKT